MNVGSERLTTWEQAETIAVVDANLLNCTKQVGLGIVSYFGQQAACPWEKDDGGTWLATAPQVITARGQALRLRAFVRLNSSDPNQVDLLELRAAKETHGEFGKGELLYATDIVRSWGANGDVLGFDEESDDCCLTVLALFLNLQQQLVLTQLPRRRLLSWATKGF